MGQDLITEASFAAMVQRTEARKVREEAAAHPVAHTPIDVENTSPSSVEAVENTGRRQSRTDLGTGNSPKAMPVRVVESHPSVAPQPVLIVGEKATSAEQIVESVEHLEGETKSGFQSLTDIFRQLFGSLKSLGKGAGGIGPPSRSNDPGRATEFEAYGAEADQHINRGQAWHERIVQENFTSEGLMDKIFDKKGIVGSYAHRRFAERRDEQSYADEMKFGKTTDGKSDRELRGDARQIGKLRGIASKAYNTLEERKARGWSETALAGSPEHTILGKANEDIGKLNAARKKRHDDWIAEREKKKAGLPYEKDFVSSDGRDRPDSKVSTKPQGETKNRTTWGELYGEREEDKGQSPAAGSSPTVTPKRPVDTSAFSEESTEEAKRDHGDVILLRYLQRLDENTKPIIRIEKFLLKGGSSESGTGIMAGAGGRAGGTAGGIVGGYGAYSLLNKGKNALLGKGKGPIPLVGRDAKGRFTKLAKKPPSGTLGRAVATKGAAAARMASGAAGGLFRAGVAGATMIGSSAAAPWLLGAAAVGLGGYAAYKGYQHLTGGDEEATGPRMTADALKVPKISTSIPDAPTINTINNQTNNSTKVITPPTKPCNDDGTVNRYMKTRWG